MTETTKDVKEWQEAPFTLTGGEPHFLYESVLPGGGVISGVVMAASEDEAKTKLEAAYPGLTFTEPAKKA